MELEQLRIGGQHALPMLVVDANFFLSDVCYRREEADGTALRRVLATGVVCVAATPEVYSEVDEHLPRVAIGRGLDPTVASARWQSLYRPQITNLPGSGLRPEEPEDDSLTALKTRDPDDVPTASLALGQHSAVIVTRDRDLIDLGLAPDNPLDVVFAAERAGQSVLLMAVTIDAAGSGFRCARAAMEKVITYRWGRFALALAAVAVAGLAVLHRNQLRSLVGKTGTGTLGITAAMSEPIGSLQAATVQQLSRVADADTG